MHKTNTMHTQFDKLTESFYRALYSRIAPAESGLRIMEAVRSGALDMKKSFTLNEVFSAVNLTKLASDLSHFADPLCDAIADPQERTKIYIRIALNTMMTAPEAILNAKCVFEDERGIRFDLSRGDLEQIQKRSLFLHPIMGYEVENAQSRTFLEFSLKEHA